MKFTVRLFRKFSFILFIGSLLGMLLHVGLIGLDVLLVEQPILIDFENEFFKSAFSFPFLPILLFEIIFSTFTIYFWLYMQNAIKHAHEQELKKEKYEATVITLQKSMALMAEHIALNNNQILGKIAFRKKQGQKTSAVIEKASQNISQILHILSEVSFVEPYINQNKANQKDLVSELERRIHEKNLLSANSDIINN